jgi:hypothetical protein
MEYVSPFFLRTEGDAVSETPCSLVFKIPDNGQSPKSGDFECICHQLKALDSASLMRLNVAILVHRTKTCQIISVQRTHYGHWSKEIEKFR